MKVKIKGLVFVGFAAAVFAQNAMAANAADKKVVASKYYVDDTFQTIDNLATSTEQLDWTSDTTYPSMKVLKGKFDALTPAVGSNAENYVDFTESGDTLTVNFDNAPATAAADLTGYAAGTADLGAALTSPADKKLVTAGAINGMILREGTNGISTITSSVTHATVPTSKNVYDFVTSQVSGAAYQPKDDTVAGLNSVQVGYNVDGNTPGWTRLTGGYNGEIGSGFIEITKDNNGVYTVDIDGHAIADSAEAIAAATSDSSDGAGQLTTAYGVYDFVNGNYQAKAADNTNTVQIGYNATWGTLSGDSTYITVNPNSGSATVSLGNLTAHGVSDTGANPAYTTDFVAAGTTNASTKRPMLARAGDVYDFVTAQLGGLAIPEPGADCTLGANGITTENGQACALVMAYDTTAQAVTLKWTPMAQ